MKKPQFTAVPNELIDVHLRELSACEAKVILVIMRRTYGWHKEQTTVSLAMIAEATGLSKSSCCEATRSLESRGLVRRQTNTSEAGGCAANTYEILFEDAPPLSENRTPPVQILDTPPFAQPNGIRNKENKNKQNYLEPSLGSLSEEKNQPLEPQQVLRKFINHRGFKKPNKAATQFALDRLEHLEFTEEEWSRAMLGYFYSDWGKENGYPIMGLLKDPESWADSGHATLLPRLVVDAPTTQPVSNAPAAQESQTGGILPIPALLETWNRLVPGAPCQDWSPSQDRITLPKEPEFYARFEEICEVSQSIHAQAVNREAGSWEGPTFRWIFKAKDGVSNWWKVLTELRRMGMVQKTAPRKKSIDELNKEVLDRALARYKAEDEAKGKVVSATR